MCLFLNLFAYWQKRSLSPAKVERKRGSHHNSSPADPELTVPKPQLRRHSVMTMGIEGFNRHRDRSLRNNESLNKSDGECLTNSFIVSFCLCIHTSFYVFITFIFMSFFCQSICIFNTLYNSNQKQGRSRCRRYMVRRSKHRQC